MTALDLPPAVLARLEHYAGQLPPEALAQLAVRLRQEVQAQREAEAARVVDHDSPGALAVSLGDVQRPHLALIDEAYVRAAREGGLRLIINIGPRYGKSRRATKVGPLWALTRNPDLPVILASHTYDLVEDASRFVREELENPERAYGITTRADSRALDRWFVRGHSGGLLVASVGGRITGFGAGLLVIDDVHANPQQAESETMRNNVWDWFTGTAFDRLEPGGSVVIVMTRWHTDDLTGRLLREHPGVWEVVSVPTVAETHGRDPGNPTRCLCGEPWLLDVGHGDPVGRAPGVLLWPERYDEEAVAEQRLVLGAYNFAARHQQKPRKRVGGLWQESWISSTRVAPRPLDAWVQWLVVRGVAVDPSASDNTEGDEAGILVGGRGPDGDDYVVADLSGKLTPEGWARRALVAAIEFEAPVIYESNLTPAFMRRSLVAAWEQLKREAAGELWTVREPEPPGWTEGKIRRVTGGGLVDLPSLMPSYKPVRAKVGKVLRAEPVAQRYEQKRVHHAGTFVDLEDQQLSWRVTDKGSPDRLDADVHLITYLGDAPNTTTAVEVPQGQVPLGAGAVAGNRFR